MPYIQFYYFRGVLLKQNLPVNQSLTFIFFFIAVITSKNFHLFNKFTIEPAKFYELFFNRNYFKVLLTPDDRPARCSARLPVLNTVTEPDIWYPALPVQNTQYRYRINQYSKLVPTVHP
jgi:hypothetical protein